MSSPPLLELLRAHAPHDALEADMLERTLRFVESEPAHLDASHPAGHITGSAWVLDESRQLVLLTHHRKLGRWFQLGGHLDPGETVLEGALREAREESGLEDVRFLERSIFDVDVHPIPARVSQPGHYHYDIRFVVEVRRTQPRASAESKEVAWVALGDVARLNPDPSMVRMVAKTRNRWPSPGQ